MRTRGIAVGCALLVSAAACGGGGGGTSYDSVQAVVDAMAEGGVTCDDVQRTDKMLVRESGTCRLDGTLVTIEIYKDADQKEQVDKAFGGLDGGPSVDGSTWDVLGLSSEQAQRVQKALGGKVT